MRGVHTFEDFSASHDHMPGSARTLRVSGVVVFSTGGWACRLQEAEGNTGTNQEMLSLDLILQPPAKGSSVTEVLTPHPVEWSLDDPAIDYRQVQFNIVGSDDVPPPVLDIDHPE